MKQITLILLLTTTFNSFAQDWSLFPPQTNMYYLPEGTTKPFNCIQDSTLTDATGTHYYFNKISPEGTSQACYDSMIAYYESAYFGYPITELQLTAVGDSILRYNEPFGTFPAIFKPLAPVGYTWTVLNNNIDSDLDSIQITCDSIVFGSFLGVTDSLKYFSVHTTDAYVGAYTIDKATYILSKNYGLIRFLPLELLINPTDCADCYRCYDLIGWNSALSSSGYSGVQWEEWIQLTSGDFLKFYHYLNSEFGTEINYITQLIDHVDHYADSIVVYYFNSYGEANSYTYYKEIIYNAISSPVQRLVRMPNSLFDTEIGNAIGINDNYEYNLDTITFPGAWRLQQGIVEDGYLDELTCEISPAPYLRELGWDSYIGVTSYSSGDANYYAETYLVGYVISGQQWGDYWPLTIEQQLIYVSNLKVYPNPASKELQILSPNSPIIDIYIYDITCNLVKICANSNGTINIADLAPGTYIIRENSKSGLRTGIFIKE